MASFTQADALERVWRMIRDTGSASTGQLLTDTEIMEVIDDALRSYSLARPRQVTVDLNPDGTNTLALPTGWVEGFSVIRSIETPTGANPPNYVDPRKWVLYNAPLGTSIRWLTDYPAAGTGTCRVTYTGLHRFGANSTDTTVPDIDFGAVCALSASLCATAISTGFAKSHEPLIAADSASYRTKSMEWASAAKNWWEVYQRHIAAGRRPASSRANWDSRLSSGVAHLTHDLWRR